MGVGKTIKVILLGINLVVALGLLFAYATRFVSPTTTVFFAFFGLAYPLFLFLNLFFILYWAIRRDRFVFISIVILLLGWFQFFQFFQFPFNKSEKIEGNTVKVMSYNVRLFDLYDWTKQENIKDKILTLVNEQDPDVVCFQEYYLKGNSSFISKAIEMPYVHEHFINSTLNGNKSSGVGTAIYSKYKIINKGKILFENEDANHCIFIDVLKDKDTIRIYNVHIGSIRFDYEDYTFLAGEKQPSTEEEMIPLKKIAKRLKIGFLKRAEQLSQLLEHTESSPYPTIIGADMNDTPVSHSHKQFSTAFKDSFNEKGSWVGSTYIGAIPLLRIDYLWFNSKLKNTSFTTINKEFSDHRPIVGEYVLVE